MRRWTILTVPEIVMGILIAVLSVCLIFSTRIMRDTEMYYRAELERCLAVGRDAVNRLEEEAERHQTFKFRIIRLLIPNTMEAEDS